jgi:hypothetical protein
MRMRILFAMVLVGLAPAQARTPERLIDRPAPQIKLVPAIGWRLAAVAMMDVSNGVHVLVVEGDVFNTSDSERASPKVRLAVLDGRGTEMFGWTVAADLERIKPGDYSSFSARLESPPDDVRTVVVSTVEAGIE